MKEGERGGWQLFLQKEVMRLLREIMDWGRGGGLSGIDEGR